MLYIIGIIVLIVIIVFIIALCSKSDDSSYIERHKNEYDYYKAKKEYENKIYEDNIKNEKDNYIYSSKVDNTDNEDDVSNTGPETLPLSSEDVKAFFSYMDRKLTSQYQKRIDKGQNTFDVGVNLIALWHKLKCGHYGIPYKGYVFMNFSQLKEYDMVIPTEQSASFLADYIICKERIFAIREKELNKWKHDLSEYKSRQKGLEVTSENNTKGIRLEKEGDIEEAIKVYEKNLEIGYPASHSYNRLMILYHKQKKYAEEIRVIKKAIDLFANDTRYGKDVIKWEDRLNKLLTQGKTNNQ